MAEATLSDAPVKAKVLVVDDDEMIRRLLFDILKRDFEVLSAPDGEQALALLKTQKVEAIISDQMMPEMNGVEFLRRSLELQPNAARMMVTASNSLEDAVSAINLAHVRRFVTKPFRPLDLISLVRGAVHEAQLEAENQRLVEEVTKKNKLLERALCEVQSQERKLELTVEQRTRELRAAMDELQDLALRDGLTGLYNHRYFQDALTAELARSARYGRVVTLIFLDVDHFKNYNDLHGHPKGDELLKVLARILKNTGEDPEIRIRGRVSDIPARYGGEEFVVILPEADKDGGLVRAERIRAQIEDFPLEGRERQPGGKVTVSIGVAAYPQDGLTKQDLIAAADQALYRAKREGRNCVRLAGVP
jgi:diguanylate cyclase (GGDEF)-like protein